MVYVQHHANCLDKEKPLFSTSTSKTKGTDGRNRNSYQMRVRLGTLWPRLVLPAPRSLTRCPSTDRLGAGGFFFFLIAGCNGSLGYWQSLATRESNKQHQWYCVPKESQVPIHYDLSHHNLCMTERMVHSEKRDTTTQEEPKQEDTNQQQKPTPTTKQKTIAGTEVRREGETVLTRSVHLLQ